MCGIEGLIYYQTIGKYTTLFVEAEKDEWTQRIVYSFYKMRCLPNGKSYFKVYCDRTSLKVVIKRIESFVLYLELNKNRTGR